MNSVSLSSTELSNVVAAAISRIDKCAIIEDEGVMLCVNKGHATRLGNLPPGKLLFGASTGHGAELFASICDSTVSVHSSVTGEIVCSFDSSTERLSFGETTFAVVSAMCIKAAKYEDPTQMMRVQHTNGQCRMTYTHADTLMVVEHTDGQFASAVHNLAVADWSVVEKVTKMSIKHEPEPLGFGLLTPTFDARAVFVHATEKSSDVVCVSCTGTCTATSMKQPTVFDIILEYHDAVAAVTNSNLVCQMVTARHADMSKSSILAVQHNNKASFVMVPHGSRLVTASDGSQCFVVSGRHHMRAITASTTQKAPSFNPVNLKHCAVSKSVKCMRCRQQVRQADLQHDACKHCYSNKTMSAGFGAAIRYVRRKYAYSPNGNDTLVLHTLFRLYPTCIATGLRHTSAKLVFKKIKERLPPTPNNMVLIRINEFAEDLHIAAVRRAERRIKAAHTAIALASTGTQ